MAQKKSRKGKGLYASYESEGSWLKNKIAKLKRTVKAQPNNKLAADALAVYTGGSAPQYKRKPSRSHHWTPARIAFAQMISFLGVSGHLALMEAPADSKEARENWSTAWTRATAKTLKNKPGVLDVSEKHRAHYAKFA